MYEYKVYELREKSFSKTMSGSMLAKILNEHAEQGWRLKLITEMPMKGNLGRIDGLLITFEREKP